VKEQTTAIWSIFAAPRLTRARIRAALVVAVLADVLQWCLGPFGWVGADQVIDIVAMVCITWLIGFHPLLLPTAIIEFLPMVDWLPTWTGCVLLVIARRKKQTVQNTEPVPAIVNPPPLLEAPQTSSHPNQPGG
jgi:hypothetical protein